MSQYLFIFKGELTDLKLMKMLATINDAGYDMTMKKVVPNAQVAEKLAPKPAPVTPIDARRYKSFKNPKLPYSKHNDFHTADYYVLKFLAEKGQATIDEICAHLAEKGYAMTTGATSVSKLNREGKIIRDEQRNVVLA